MQVIVEAKNMEVTSGLRKHAQQQSKKLTKHTPPPQRVHVMLEVVKKKTNDPQANVAKVIAEVPGKDAVVKKKAADMYEAMTQAFDALERDLRKAAEKQRTQERSASSQKRATLLGLL